MRPVAGARTAGRAPDASVVTGDIPGLWLRAQQRRLAGLVPANLFAAAPPRGLAETAHDARGHAALADEVAALAAHGRMTIDRKPGWAYGVDDPRRLTRAWCAWANRLFGELVVRLATECPHRLAETL